MWTLLFGAARDVCSFRRLFCIGDIIFVYFRLQCPSYSFLLFYCITPYHNMNSWPHHVSPRPIVHFISRLPVTNPRHPNPLPCVYCKGYGHNIMTCVTKQKREDRWRLKAMDRPDFDGIGRITYSGPYSIFVWVSELKGHGISYHRWGPTGRFLPTGTFVHFTATFRNQVRDYFGYLCQLLASLFDHLRL